MCQVWYSGMQGIYACLKGINMPWVYVHCSIYIIYIYISAMRCDKFGVVVLQACMLDWGCQSAICRCALFYI